MKTDAQLIREARGNASALDELYRRHAPGVHAWLRARAGEEIAVELTAETFAQAALSLRRFRDEADGSARPWLRGIARNLLRGSFERQRLETAARRRLGMSVPTSDDFDAVDERERADRLRRALADALASLPADQRAALELRVVGDLAYRDVASSLQISEVAARLRVRRALASLSRLLRGAV